MIGPLSQLMAKAATKVPWWKVAATTAATAAAAALGSKIVEKILSDEDLTFEQKLDRLNKAYAEGKITKEEWQKVRDSLMAQYASQR